MELSLWENIFLGIMALGVLFWFVPRIKYSLQASRQEPSDWVGVLLPISCVVGLVIVLIASV